MSFSLQDAINETLRLVMPNMRERTLLLGAAYTANGTSLTFTTVSDANSVVVLRPGHQISIDLEMFYVTAVNSTTNVATVIPGWRGSTSANHANGAVAFIEPKFSWFDIAQQINHDLAALSSPLNGLYQMKTVDVTFNPILRGFDLAGLDADDVLDIYDIVAKQATPDQYWPRIDRWKLERNMTDAAFPSSLALMIYNTKGGWPGLPFHIYYKAPFGQLTYLTDDATTVAGVPSTAVDLLPLGAALRLTPGREVERNFADVQADPRRAQEVPPGAVLNAGSGLARTRQLRISEEAARLTRMYPPKKRGRR